MFMEYADRGQLMKYSSDENVYKRDTNNLQYVLDEISKSKDIKGI